MNPILWLLVTFIDLYKWVVIISVIMSLLISFNIINRYQPFVQQIGLALSRLTEPVLGRIRRIMPPLGGLDLSPVLLLIGLEFVKRALIYYFA
jgi:YggT family protein